ncbi:hypothetical protein EHE21_07495 [Proteus sp. GOKU]|uniref:phage tail fiber protein n=1 Tax=Proteus TaxID=583 RepID=UPI001892927E|nr:MULTISPECIES: hypothetical protein [Proteus]QPB79235.1 hypothetical protein EHE21_07495 [Proteus sp. GOKU]QQP25242.1 hypothetical protein D7029_07495 [Proteus vulgaris]
MIYTTGTVNTVSGSAIVKGTGTKFKNNNPAINIGMTILIKSGNTNIPYMIKSVNSDTELVLAQPALATATNTTFSIHITEPDNNSDAARTMVAINSYTQYFLDAMNTWMTQTGQTKVEMPNGEIVTLDSIKKMQGDIANKLDTKKGGIQRVEGELRLSSAIGVVNNNESNAAWISLVRGHPDIYIKREGVSNCLYSFPDPKLGNRALMGVGDYGIGGAGLSEPSLVSCFYGSSSGSPGFPSNGAGWQSTYNGNRRAMLFMNTSGILMSRFSSSNDVVDTTTPWNAIWSAKNTTVDSNGFIKRASPIIDINPDGTFTTNDESEGATVTRVAQGEYLIEGVLGFNSDAGWGGVDGGIEIPLDVNKQPLIWVNSKINKDGSILVKTYHRTYPNAPKFARNDIDGFNDGDPIDIPDGRFISVRVQMPEQSIYNVRMHEMEEAQKAEEERRQKEEEIKAKFGLGKSDILV